MKTQPIQVHRKYILFAAYCMLLFQISCYGQVNYNMDCYSGSWTKDSGSNASRTCLADRPYCRSYHQIQQLNFTREVYRQIFLLDNSNSSDDGRNQLNCLGNFSCPFAVNEVIHMNKTQWLQFANDTLMHNKNCCAVVLFYSSSCSFSAQLAPAYNAIGHIFPNLTTISVNAYDNRYYNIRFGVMGTPTVLIFVRARRILRFNSTATFNNLVQFVSNVTGLSYNASENITDLDNAGPVTANVSDTMNIYLMLSYVYTLIAFAYLIIKYPIIQKYWKIVKEFARIKDD